MVEAAFHWRQQPDYIFSLLKHIDMVITWMTSCSSKKQQSCASFPQLLDMMNTWHFSDCSGVEHKEGSVHHDSLSQYSCNILPGDAYATSLWVFMGWLADEWAFTLQPCPSCWSPVLQRWGTCSPLLPSSMCRWPNPEWSQAAHWPEERKKCLLNGVWNFCAFLWRVCIIIDGWNIMCTHSKPSLCPQIILVRLVAIFYHMVGCFGERGLCLSVSMVMDFSCLRWTVATASNSLPAYSYNLP